MTTYIVSRYNEGRAFDGESVADVYARERAKGWRADSAIQTARTRIAWRDADGYLTNDDDVRTDENFNEDATVRLYIVADEDGSSATDFDCDCEESRSGHVSEQTARGARDYRGVTCRHKLEQIERANLEGVWGVVGQFRNPLTDEWTDADSCFGFIETDWIDSGYDSDIMQAALDARESALQAMRAAYRVGGVRQ